MSKPIEENNKITVGYCDGSITEETYLTTSFGNLSAKEKFHEFVEMGQDNDKVWAKFPHVHKVEIYLADPKQSAR